VLAWERSRQHIGKVLVMYRENPPAPPPARRKAPPQRTWARTVAKASARGQRPPRPDAKSNVVSPWRPQVTPTAERPRWFRGACSQRNGAAADPCGANACNNNTSAKGRLKLGARACNNASATPG
jgi:hypothetical protein